ncbi:MAG TPA: aminotransferase class III-fold pyridoxal phosphate-dependent enzyme, partial [Chryseosolibacter sp.]
ADEVFTGFGRTGRNFAVDYLKNKPDILALSKGITGGFMALGVTSCTKRIVEAFDSQASDKTFHHGHSYTANPLACAAANASFELLIGDACKKKINEISEMHARFANRMKGNKKILDARMLGTILALEVRAGGKSNYENALRAKIYSYFLEKNILLRPLGNVLYVLPPYVIAEEELTAIYESIEEFLETI